MQTEVPCFIPAFFFVPEEAAKSAGNAVIPTFLCIGHTNFKGLSNAAVNTPTLLLSMGITRQKWSWRNRLQMAHVHFRSRKRVHTRLSEKDCTQELTRRNTGPSSLQTQHGFVLPAKSSPKEQPEEADARLRRVSASSGVAALPGCVTLFVIWQCCCFSLCAQEFLHSQGEGVSLPSAYSACY